MHVTFILDIHKLVNQDSQKRNLFVSKSNEYLSVLKFPYHALILREPKANMVHVSFQLGHFLGAFHGNVSSRDKLRNWPAL